MGWLNDAWLKRVAITLDNTGANASADYDIVIPSWFDAFWDAIDDDGNELRLTHANGVTVADYDIDNTAGGAFNAAAVTARAGRLRLNGFATAATASMVLAWLYFDSTSTQGDGSGTAGAGPETGYIDLAGPSQHATVYQPQRPGLTRPRSVRTKSANESLNFWFDLSAMFERQNTPGRKRRVFEEALYMDIEVLDSGGSDVGATMHTLANNRFVSTRDGRLWAKINVEAGSTATPYTIAPRVRTVVPRSSSVNTVYRTLQPRMGLQVQDVLQDS